MADRFIKGTLILTAAGLMVKILASVNRIFLSRLLGGEGIGLYQLAYPLFNLLTGIAAAGIPAAMSLFVSQWAAKKEWGTVRHIFRVSMVLFVTMGLAWAAFALLMIPHLFSGGIIKDGRALLPMLSCVPALALAVPLAGLRGYFQGFQEMKPTAVSQILEQFVRVAVMLALAVMLLPRGLEVAAAGAIFGAAPGTACGLLLLIWCYFRQQKKWNREALLEQAPAKPLSVRDIAGTLAGLALPVTLSSLMIPLVGLIEIVLVPSRLLAAGFTIAASTTALGYLSGMAMPLVNMGTIPTNSLAWSTVPAISEARALGDDTAVRSKARTALRILILFNLPAATGIFVLGTPIARILYGAMAAGPVVSALAPAVFLLGLHQVTAAILQGIGHQRVPMVNMFLSLFVKIGVLWVLVADPAWSIIGAALATDLNLATAAVLNLIFLYRECRVLLPFLTLLRGAVASALMAAGVVYAYQELFLLSHANWVTSTLGAIGAGVLIYGAALLILGEIRARELRHIVRRHSK